LSELTQEQYLENAKNVLTYVIAIYEVLVECAMDNLIPELDRDTLAYLIKFQRNCIASQKEEIRDLEIELFGSSSTEINNTELKNIDGETLQ